MLFGGKSVLGLDIGASALKAVQIKDLKDGFELEVFDILPIDRSIIGEESVKEPALLVAAIKELLKKAKIKTKNVIISVSGHSSVIIKRISLPQMSEEELTESIRFEAEQYVPFGIDDVNLDFQIIGPAAEEGQIDVILVAVKKDLINEYLGIVKDAGLNPVIVDVGAFALENMYEANYEVDKEKSVALIDLGDASMKLSILKGGVSALTRDTAIGSRLHNELLMRELGITYEEAEKVKLGKSPGGAAPEQAVTILAQGSEEIVTEIIRTLEFFGDSPDMEPVEEIILCGGGALVLGLSDLLADKTGITVTVVNPFKNIKIPKKFDPQYIESAAPIAAAAVGLALRRIGDR
jgi:type IV pilus assembly protein PilM